MTITWLEGVDLFVDGGRVFGPVPKAVWKRYTPYTENNDIPNSGDPILIQYQNKNYLIDASLNLSKMDRIRQRNEGVRSKNHVLESLKILGLRPEDIDVVLLTHAHNDHMGGLTYLKNGSLYSTFPHARIYIHAYDWEDVKNPTGRTKGTYLRENWEPIQEQVITFSDKIEIIPEIHMTYTGGHTRGLAHVELFQKDERILHMSDNFASTYHSNPNWVMAIDDYPLEVTKIREAWFPKAFETGTKFIFYHDPYIRLAEFDQHGKEMVYGLLRSRSIGIEPTSEQDKLKWPLKTETNTF